MSKITKFDYEHLVQESLRTVVHSALTQVAKNGLPGNHHFYISFRTDYPGVDLPDYLLEQYPEEITIVLQYEFWDLEVEEECFFVTLCFNDIHERLTIPFQAIVSFVDPSVKFGLQFSPTIHEKVIPRSSPFDQRRKQNPKRKQILKRLSRKMPKMAQMLLCWMPFERNNPPSAESALEKVLEAIRGACVKAGRPPNSVALLVATKNRPIEDILPLLKCGQRWFGENRVQEATAKWSILRPDYPDLRLHLIGPLQTNKVNQALQLFDVIESVDRPELVEALTKAWRKGQRVTSKILIQVNIGREPQKSGVLLEDLPNLIELCRRHALPLTGLMCIPPAEEDPKAYFQQLAELSKYHHLPDLSMGMSADFPVAIAHGATWVRVGSALWSSWLRPGLALWSS